MIDATSLATSAVGGAMAIVGALAWVATDPPKFMDVSMIAVSDGMVTAQRKVHVDTVADWQVTIVEIGESAPICQTAPGPSINMGWSQYRRAEPEEQFMPLDVWAGDRGCAARLEPGVQYNMYTTWTPRNDLPPVTGKVVFAWEG